MRIELLWPHKHLSPNARVHWAVKSKHVKAARQEAFLCVATGGGVLDLLGTTGLRVSYTFHPGMKRRRDLDNLIASTKATTDGIAVALGVDDSTFKLSYALGEIRKPAVVIVEIT